MAVSEYNFLASTDLQRNFPITQYELTKKVTNGEIKMTKHKGRYVYPIDAVFALFYPGNEATLVKRWNYPYEDIYEKWVLLRERLKMLPVCFMMLPEERETGIYRVYDRNRTLKFFMFVDGKECTLQAYNKDALDDFKRFYKSEWTWI